MRAGRLQTGPKRFGREESLPQDPVSTRYTSWIEKTHIRLALSEAENNPFPFIPPGSPTGGVKSPHLDSSSRDVSTTNSVPPHPLPASSSSFQSTPSASLPPSPNAGGRKDLSPDDTTADDLRTPTRSHLSGSGAWSTVATPGLPDSETGEKRFDLKIPPPSPPEAELNAGGEKRNVRFMGPDGAPLSPATTHVSVDSYDAPAAPPPPIISATPMRPRSPQQVVIVVIRPLEAMRR
jgi:vacuolar protein sorting-associated protein VTA1